MSESEGLCLVAEDLSYVARGSATGVKAILKSVNLIAKPGELLAIMGPSGSGKTSLLNIISGRTRNALANAKQMVTDSETPFEKAIPTEILGSAHLKRAPVPYGRILLNNTPVGFAELRQASRYVMQSDCLLPYLSVYETVRFAAQLKMSHLPTAERAQIVESVINGLGLDVCRDVCIGNQVKKGISGGQRKRVSIAIELLEDPQLLFLDEPTSGLDSSLAFDVLKTVKELVKNSKKPDASGRVRLKTVICTIHQPRKQIFDMFDRLALLSLGEIVYQGPAKEIADFWKAVGHPLPLRQNVADWSLDLLTAAIEQTDAVEGSPSRVGSFTRLLSKAGSYLTTDPQARSESFIAAQDPQNLPVSNAGSMRPPQFGPDKGLKGVIKEARVEVSEDEVMALPGKFKTSVWGDRLMEELQNLPQAKLDLGNSDRHRRRECTASVARMLRNIMTLTHRFYLNRWRNKISIFIMIGVNFLLSLFAGFVFWRLPEIANDTDCTAYFNVIGAVAFTGINQSFGVIQNWIEFPNQRPMLNRERASGLYSPVAALVGMVLGDLPFAMIPPLVHTLTVFWTVGLGDNQAKYFFFYWLFAVSICWGATGWMMLAATTAPTATAASAIAPVGVVVSVLLCGLWITESALPLIWKTVKYITWVRYGVNAFLQFRYNDSGISDNCAPIPKTPGPAGNLITLFCLGVIYRIFAGFALAFCHTRQGLEA